MQVSAAKQASSAVGMMLCVGHSGLACRTWYKQLAPFPWFTITSPALNLPRATAVFRPPNAAIAPASAAFPRERRIQPISTLPDAKRETLKRRNSYSSSPAPYAHCKTRRNGGGSDVWR
eukprot:226430-Rhodomonas_salina.1